MHVALYLRDCGYVVLEAASADEAIVILQSEHSVDLVLTDVEMPGSMDGFGLAKWVRANKKSIEVVLGGTPERAAETAGELCEEGPSLAKPYDHQVLADLIRRHLGLSKNQK
jgi:CheY-like chemotaxis protein